MSLSLSDSVNSGCPRHTFSWEIYGWQLMTLAKMAQKNITFIVLFCTFASPRPLLYSKSLFLYTMLFSLPKFPRFGSFTTVYQKKAHFCHLFAVFFSVFWAPTGHPGAPFTIKLCNLAYNNIFDSQSFWESEVSWIYTQKIAHSGLFFKLFFVLFWATTGQPAIYTQSLYSSIQ